MSEESADIKLVFKKPESVTQIRKELALIESDSGSIEYDCNVFTYFDELAFDVLVKEENEVCTWTDPEPDKSYDPSLYINIGLDPFNSAESELDDLLNCFNENIGTDPIDSFWCESHETSCGTWTAYTLTNKGIVQLFDPNSDNDISNMISSVWNEDNVPIQQNFDEVGLYGILLNFPSLRELLLKYAKSEFTSVRAKLFPDIT